MGHLHAAIGSGGACALACGRGVQATGFSVVVFFFTSHFAFYNFTNTTFFSPLFNLQLKTSCY